jgi:hypothetical protein
MFNHPMARASLFPQLFASEQPNEEKDYGNYKQYVDQQAYAW